MWVVEEGPLKNSLLKKSIPSNLELRFLGHIAYDKLSQVYARCGILCFPILADEWGLVVNEAMAAGLPVLGSLYSQAVEELVEDNITGWIFRPDHHDEMYNAIDRALRVSNSMLMEMGACARRRVMELTPSSVADRIYKVVEYVSKAPGSEGTQVIK